MKWNVLLYFFMKLETSLSLSSIHAGFSAGLMMTAGFMVTKFYAPELYLLHLITLKPQLATSFTAKSCINHPLPTVTTLFHLLHPLLAEAQVMSPHPPILPIQGTNAPQLHREQSVLQSQGQIQGIPRVQVMGASTHQHQAVLPWQSHLMQDLHLSPKRADAAGNHPRMRLL